MPHREPRSRAGPPAPAYWHYDHMPLPLPQRHRYPRSKYGLVRRRLLDEGIVAPEQLVASRPEDWSLLGLLHTPAYLEAVRAGTLSRRAEREIGLPFTPELATRARCAVHGTVQAAVHALRFGAAGNLGGGNHHGFPERGSGYCVFNDIAVAIRYLQHFGMAGRVAVIDLDVHQGNANAEIFRDDPDVFTLSVHGERNWPYRKAVSDLDVPLPDGTEDAAYLAALEAPLDEVFGRFRPALVFYQAGVDPLRGDRLGRLALSAGGLRARDRLVLERARAHRCAVAVTMGGGYAVPVEETVAAHVHTFREMQALWAPAPVPEARAAAGPAPDGAPRAVGAPAAALAPEP